jgi:hypothetical protein
MATSSLAIGSTVDPQDRPGYRKLGLLNGLLIGAALALGSWGQEGWRLAGLPVENAYTSVILGSIILITLCGFTGWLTSRFARSWITIISWFITAVLTALIIGYQPYIGRTVAEWLADSRAWGLAIYTSQALSNTGLILGGLLIILTLFILALLQESRLEQAVIELGDGGRISGRSWFTLLLPLPLVALVAYVTSSWQVNPAAAAAAAVHQAIEVARTTEGDLFQLGIQEGVNYGAINAVRDQLTEDYSLRIGDIDPQSSQTFILAEFDNGAWINCRTMNDQLSFCFDALPPYKFGLLSLISGEPPPENCRGCLPRADEAWVSWLQERAALLGPTPRTERLGQWGGYVLMRVIAADDSYAIDCLFNKMSPLQLDHCREVQP